MKFDKKLIRRIGTASFNDGEKIRRKFASAHAKWDSWWELLLGENYSPTSTYDESKEAWLEGWFAPGDTYMEAALLGLLF
jgi:hypothetical protein